MSDSNLLIPLKLLSMELKGRIPSDEKVLYTSHCGIKKHGLFGLITYGQLAITNKAVIFFAKKMGFYAAGLYSRSYGLISKENKENKGYLPFDQIIEFKNKKNKISIEIIIPDEITGGTILGYDIWIERCKEIKERKNDFKKRRKNFGDFVESLYST